MEIAILESLQAIHTPVLTYIMLAFTYLGEVGAVCIVTTAIFLIFPKTRKGGFVLAAALIVDFLIVNLFLKNVVARPRPFTKSDALLAFLNSVSYKIPSDWSFPSGHSAVCFCGASVLTILYKGKAAWTYAVAAIVAFSRLYLGVHYLTDVLAGAAIGSLIGGLIGIYGGKLYDHVLAKIRARREKKNEEDID